MHFRIFLVVVFFKETHQKFFFRVYIRKLNREIPTNLQNGKTRIYGYYRSFAGDQSRSVDLLLGQTTGNRTPGSKGNRSPFGSTRVHDPEYTQVHLILDRILTPSSILLNHRHSRNKLNMKIRVTKSSTGKAGGYCGPKLHSFR